MATGLCVQASSTYSKLQTFTHTDAAKQKVIQLAAIIIAANAVYNACTKRLAQAGLNLYGAAILWITQEVFLHKALAENVSCFAVENDRLSSLVDQFETIGLHLQQLSAEEKEQIKKQMHNFNQLFDALNAVVSTQTQAAQKHAQTLENRMQAEKATLMENHLLLNKVCTELLQTFQSVSSQDDLLSIKQSVQILVGLAKKTLEKDSSK